MTNKLNEIKKLSEDSKRFVEATLLEEHWDNSLPYKLARHTLNLIVALEKCREQRNKYIANLERPGESNVARFLSMDDLELTAILDGK